MEGVPLTRRRQFFTQSTPLLAPLLAQDLAPNRSSIRFYTDIEVGCFGRERWALGSFQSLLQMQQAFCDMMRVAGVMVKERLRSTDVGAKNSVSD